MSARPQSSCSSMSSTTWISREATRSFARRYPWPDVCRHSKRERHAPVSRRSTSTTTSGSGDRISGISSTTARMTTFRDARWRACCGRRKTTTSCSSPNIRRSSTPRSTRCSKSRNRHRILTDIAGNSCVLFSANDAYMRDLRLYVPSDCTVSNTQQENDSALTQMCSVLKADITPSELLDLTRLAGRETGPALSSSSSRGQHL